MRRLAKGNGPHWFRMDVLDMRKFVCVARERLRDWSIAVLSIQDSFASQAVRFPVQTYKSNYLTTSLNIVGTAEYMLETNPTKSSG